MKIARAELKSISPYSQSRRIGDRKPKEDWMAYERRLWRDRIHVNEAGQVVIPSMAFKRSIENAAKFLRMRIPGKGQSEYGKHFEAGVLVVDALPLVKADGTPLKREEVEGEELYLSSRGKRGQMDVLKIEPVIREWTGTVSYYIVDDTIGCEVFAQHLREAGNFIGIGRFRPVNGGYYGRYEVKGIAWEGDLEEAE